MWSRRSFVGAAGSLASLAALYGSSPAAASAIRARKTLRDMVLIDTLSGIGRENDPDGAPLSASDLSDIRESNLTAINLTVDDVGIGEFAHSFENTVQVIAHYNAQIAAHPASLLQVRTAADIVEAKRSGRLGLIYGLQDSAPIGEDVQRIGMLCDLGVRIFQLTYNKRNLAGDGCLEPDKGGLSRFGWEVVQRLNENRAIVDLAHANSVTTFEAISASKRPIAITHTGCSGINPNPRNKTDEELKAVADSGGYIGIYMVPAFLSREDNVTSNNLIEHIEHAVNVCGEDSIGIGSDCLIPPAKLTGQLVEEFGAWVADRQKRGVAAPGESPKKLNFISELNIANRSEKIAGLLAERNHSWTRIEKILGSNFLRYARDVWGN
jgi:membrane dipeptidase